MADEKIKQDANNKPVIAGLNASDEVRNIRTDDEGNLITSGGGGGSASGGGLATYYAKPSGTNADATSAYASATTLTVTGLAYSFTKYDIVSIRQIPNAGGSGTQDTLFSDVADFSVSGTTITVAGATFAATDEFIVSFALPAKTIDTSNNAQDSSVINPDWSRWTPAQQVSVTNETNATVDRYVDMDGYNHFSLQFEKTGGTDTVTLKVYGSLQDDGTADASKTYQDITQYGMEISTASATAASYTADATIHLPEGNNYKTLKIETISAGGANDADYSLYGKKWFA